MQLDSLISITERGLYCPPADLYIDPWKPVSRAVITHAHADHARGGNHWYLAHHRSRGILKHRLGDIRLDTVDYNQSIHKNGVKISLHPAGHIIGSAQVRLEHKGKICVITGDFKLEDDQISTPFEPVSAHILIMESTFGLPIYHWQDQHQVFSDINEWWRKNRESGQISILCGYALGKAQRLLRHLNRNLGNVFVHGSIQKVNQVLDSQKFDFREFQKASPETPKKELEGAMIITPYSALNTSWMKKFHPYSTAIASGWMALRGARRRRSVDRGFVLSDHADWDGLNRTVKEVNAEKIYVTHGYRYEFSKWLNENGYPAEQLNSFFEGELGEINEQATGEP